MEKRSKTNKEIFEEEFPLEEIMNSTMLCLEAIGYLKALIQYFPSEENWARSRMAELMIIVLIDARK